MQRPLPHTELRWPSLLAFVGALALAAGLFLLIPITQALESYAGDMFEVRESPVVSIPPPPQMPPPPEEQKTYEEEVKPEPPEYEEELHELDIPRLQFDLNPGRGVAMNSGPISMPKPQKVDTIGEIEKIFNFDELSQPPRVVNAGMIRLDFPRELSRRGIRNAEAVAEILIDKTGKVKQAKVVAVNPDHVRLRESARKTALQLRFTITKVNGRAVEVRGRIPISLQAPR